MKSARLWVDVTQTELSHRTGIPQQTFSKWERGVHEPSFAAVLKVLGACGLDLIVTPIVREDNRELPARVFITGGQAFPRSQADALAKNRRTRRAQLRQYARERP